jgi:lipopolysaccharide export system permease protein
MLPRYLLRETASLYIPGVLLFIGLITTDFLSSYSGVFLRAKTPPSEILQMVAYQLPNTLGIALPLGLVFALLVTVARWIRQSELKATFAAGVSPGVFVLPVVLLGLFVSSIVLINEGWVKPISTERFEGLRYKLFYGSEPSGVLTDRSYTPEGLGIYYAQTIYPPPKGGVGSRLENIRIVEPTGSVWSARSGVWIDGAWRLKDAHRVSPEGKVFKVADQPLPFPVGVPVRNVPYDALVMPELHKVAAADSSAQFPLARRYSNALGAVVLAWLAIVIGLGLREPSWAFITIVALIFGYWIMFNFAGQFAKLEFWAVAGAWVPNVIYGLAAAVATWRLLR